MKFSMKWRKWTGHALYALFLAVMVEVALRVYLVHFANAGNFEIYASKRMLENRFEEPWLIPLIKESQIRKDEDSSPGLLP